MGFLNRTAIITSMAAIFCSSVSAQLWKGIIDPTRATDWTQAGAVVGSPGALPDTSWTQCGSTIAAGASAATINAAIAACAANHYVLLGPGTFNLTTGLIFDDKSNVVLRGSGSNSTFLVFTGYNGCSGAPSASICLMSGDINYSGGPSNVANWTAGYSPGGTTITLSSVANLKVGYPITLDQQDDTSDTGNVYVCTVQGTCSIDGSDGGAPRAGRSQQQIGTVASCDGNSTFGHACSSGTNITLAEPLVMPNWSSSKSPQAWWSSSPIFQSGVENLSLSVGSAGGNEGITFFNCSGCWASGVRVVGPPDRSHVMMWQSNHITVMNSYFFKTNDSASVNYGVEPFPASFSLVMNNIFQQIQAPYPANGSCTGCVFAYNFDVNNVFTGGTWQQASGWLHTSGDDHILYEGNQGAGIDSDDFHGSHNMVTIFRNAYNGWQPNEGTTTTGGLGALVIDGISRYYNMIGNVLGSSVFTNYMITPSNLHPANTSVMELGMGDAVANDPLSVTTAMLWGNYDTVTAAVRWCGNSSSPGWSTTCGGVSEVPSTVSPYGNAVPASTTLPASFFLSAKPSWWPSAKAWPPIGPDVTGGNLSGYAGHANTIPSADCYSTTMGGPTNGTGSVLAFNSGTCYGSSSGGTGSKNPSNLQGNVITQ